MNINVAELIESLRIERYFDDISNLIIENLGEEDQVNFFNLIEDVLDNDTIDLYQQIEVIENVINEAIVTPGFISSANFKLPVGQRPTFKYNKTNMQSPINKQMQPATSAVTSVVK
jgi:hypothetical protein